MTELCTTLAARGLMGQLGEGVCVYYGSPEDTPGEELRMHAGFELHEGKIASPLDGIVLPADRYAVMRYTGPFSGLATAYRAFLAPGYPPRA